MRRKVLQDFANVFCQRILQLPEGYDLASFVHYGSGSYELDILTGMCAFNGSAIPKLRTCDTFRNWLFTQMAKHRIETEPIKDVRLTISVIVSQLRVGQSYGHEFASAHFCFDCQSEIRTDEKSYTSSAGGEKKWAFDWYYNQLYGSALELTRRTA